MKILYVKNSQETEVQTLQTLELKTSSEKHE